MSLPNIPLPASALAVMARLKNCGYHAHIVGGSVRDALRGEIPHDYDMTTDATPEEMLSVFQGEKVIETGIRHGTLTVLYNGDSYEITTYRVDGGYSDHRHPDKVSFTRSLKEDLARRDFTMNAIAYTPDEGYIDPFGGIDDIRSGCIRAVGDPSVRFEEDALRILRAIRFSSVLAYSISPQTKAAIFDYAQALKLVSVERVRDELMKLLAGPNAAFVLHDFASVIAVCIPELSALFHCPQHTPYHAYDVWTHTLLTVKELPSDPLLRLAGLLHDIAKPACRTTDENGIDHFKEHAIRGAKIAEDILARLRFDNNSRAFISTLILHHDDRTLPIQGDVLRLLSAVGYKQFLTLCTLEEADLKAHDPSFPATQLGLEQLNNVKKMGIALQESGACYQVRDLAISGDDILARTSLRGQAIGKALNELLDAVMDGKIQNTSEELLAYLTTSRFQ